MINFDNKTYKINYINIILSQSINRYLCRSIYIQQRLLYILYTYIHDMYMHYTTRT